MLHGTEAELGTSVFASLKAKALNSASPNRGADFAPRLCLQIQQINNERTGDRVRINISKWLILPVIIGSFLVVSGCSVIYHHYPFKEMRDVRVIETRLQQAVSNSDRLTMKVAGQVVYQEHTLPIWLVTYSNSAQPQY